MFDSLKILICLVPLERIPSHVAFIMDGNRRYSKMKNISKRSVYLMGAQNLLNFISIAYRCSIKEISFYKFSLDNFGRREEEQNEIFESIHEVIEERIIKRISFYRKLGIHMRFVGKTSLLPDYLQKLGHKLELLTRPSNDEKINLMVNINLAYSGFNEICRAGESIGEKFKLGLIDQISLESFESCLYLKESKPVDLMIRTGNELRKSDFLLWESSNSIFFIVDKMWPLLNQYDMLKAILYYQNKFY